MNEAEDAATVVAGTIPIFGQLGATHSFVSFRFARKISGMPIKLELEFYVATPSEEVLNCKEVLKGCAMTKANRELGVDLVIMDMYDYDVILVMDWLSLTASW